jgi:hypothetical protein
MRIAVENGMTKGKRSPLRNKPLRNPGQALDEQIRDLVTDYFVGPFLFAGFLAVMAVHEWWRYYFKVPPSPYLYTFVAIVAVTYAAYRGYNVFPHLRALKLGRDGEKFVGQFLEGLRAQGYHPFHDIVADGFNIDHVLIGPAGVFTVETKTHSKPIGRHAQIVFDGERILVGGFEPDRNPVSQAKAQAGWLGGLLNGSYGRKFEVWPVLVYPGWFVNDRAPRPKSMWVLSLRELPKFLENEPTRLTPEDIAYATADLGRFVRGR